MGITRMIWKHSWLAVLAVLTLGVLAVACSSGDDDSPDNTTPLPTPPALESGGVMRLTILDGGSCDAGQCSVDAGSTFTLAVEVVEAPALDYILMQTFIEFGVYDPTASEDEGGPDSCGDGIDNGEQDGIDRLDEDCVIVDLVYVPSAAAKDDVVWEDLSPDTALRANIGPGTVLHGGLTGLVPPLPTSSATGVVVQFEISCPADPVQVPVSLLAYEDPLAGTSGSLFVGTDGDAKIVPDVAPITVNCE